MYSNNLILLSHRKENLIKESNRKNQQKKKIITQNYTKLHKICQIKRDISDALFIGNERDPKGLKRDSKRNQFPRSFFQNNSSLKDGKKYLFCKQTHLSIPLITTSPMFSRAGTSHSLPQRAPSIQLSPSIPGSRCKLQRNNVLGRSPAGLPRRTEKKNRSRNTFVRIDSPHTTQQLRFHLR